MKLTNIIQEANSRYTEEAKKAFGDGALAWAEKQLKDAKKEKYLKALIAMYQRIVNELKAERKTSK